MPRRTGTVQPRQSYRVSWEPMKRRRMEMRVGQRELAQAVGVVTMTILRIEKGRTDPSLSVCLGIARALGTPLAQLIEIHEK